jgi:hypothetical protein
MVAIGIFSIIGVIGPEIKINSTGGKRIEKCKL